MCNIEKHIKKCKKYAECKDCNSKSGLERYYENRDKISIQRKIYYEKKKNTLLQKQNDRYIHFKDLVGTYVE